MGPLRVLITGASRGIGLALARRYLSRGDAVIACVRGSVPADLVRAAERCVVLSMDVASSESVHAARAACRSEHVNILINNAGLNGGPQRAPGMALERVERIVNINAVGPVRVYDSFIDLVRIAPERRVLVNISSDSGSLGRFRASSKPEYAMSKAALNALTRWVAAVEPEIIAVSLHPGWTRTSIGGDQAPASPEETAELLVASIDALGAAHSGMFLDRDLQPIPW